LNDVTPSFVQNRQTTTPPPLSEPSQRLEDLPVRHRFTARPPVEPVTEVSVPSTTLQPHQPPLSIYMASNSREPQVIDVLRSLKNADSIPVIDTFSHNLPQAFVGPANLNPPSGFGKFELPYLSNLDSRRLESRNNLPFFVAPLNFNPPEGYAKIPFPAPHVGSVVVSTDTELPTTPNEPGTTPQAFIQEQANSLEPEITTLLPETTTTIRPRGRRPSQYRTRRPVSQRQRVTQRPQEEEVTQSTQENVVTQDFLREPQEERKRPTHSRRQRLRTTSTTETLEPIVTEAPLPPVVQPEAPFEAQGSVVRLQPQFVDLDQPQPPASQLQHPVHPPSDFQRQHQRPVQPLEDFRQEQPIHPPVDFRTPDLSFRPPPPPTFNQFGATLQPPQPAFQQPAFVQQPPPFNNQFQPAEVETPGIFEVPPPPPSQPQDVPAIESNGDSGFQQPIEQFHKEVSTAQPPTTQFDIPSSSVISEIETESTSKPISSSITLESETNPDAETIVKELENKEIPKKTSKFSYPNVPGVKSHPNPTKVRSHVRSRPRGSHNYKSPTTTTTESTDEEPAHVEVSATAEEGTTTTEANRSKYHSHFNRTRKPLRTTTPRTETTSVSSTSSRAHTVRPLRRTTAKTSVSTKRIRKPTTPSPNHEEEEKKEFAPSAASNEVYDEIPKQKVRKPYFHKLRTTTEAEEIAASSPSAPSADDEPKLEESRVSESGREVTTEEVSGPSGASGPSGPEEEPKKHSEDRKKTEYTKKVCILHYF